MQILKLSLDEIKIPEYRQRKEFDGEKLAELMDSISKVGLLHPIVVRDGNILVAGERRLRAATHLKDLGQSFNFGGEPWQEHIPAVDIGDLDPLAAEEAELEENICRVDLSWQERAAATDRLADLRRRQAAVLGQLPPSVGEIAEEVRGSSAGSAREDTRRELVVAKHLSTNPEVAKAKSLKEAFEVLKRQEAVHRNHELALVVGKTFSAAEHLLVNRDCLEWMGACDPEQFDVICTDPPYGINAQDFGDADGRLVTQTHKYDDSYEAWKELMGECSRLWYKVAKKEAHLYVCCDIDRFVELKAILDTDGWVCHRTPIINFKKDGNRVPWPFWGPQRKWELVLYAMKGKKPVTKIYPDVVETKGDENLGHGAQKPVSLYLDLLRRSVRPGDRVLDTFAGTGTIFVAANEFKVAAVGVEVDPNYYAIALKRLQALRGAA